MKKEYQKGRGAQINPHIRFEKQERIELNELFDEPEMVEEQATKFIRVYPKTILNKTTSPDIPFDYSMNPYQGCEHGCVYCYARTTHPFWGYSAGLDFERVILVKESAPVLLEKMLKKKSWTASPIMLSGNTDCYQPIERKLEITRKILEVFWKYRHPVGIITKNALILRDLDILKKLNAHNLVRVALSITTLNEDLRRLLEPRTASVQQRLNTLAQLSQNGIPVRIMFAPIIPGLNNHEMLPLAQKVYELGAQKLSYTIVRLNDEVADIFEDWLDKTMPDRKEKVMNQIKSLRGGNLGEKRFGKRMRGEGRLSEIIRQQYELVNRKYFSKELNSMNVVLHENYKDNQLKLF